MPLTESNETNNTYNVVQVTVTAPLQAIGQPDLSEYVAVSSTTIAAGSSVYGRMPITMNLGNAVAGVLTDLGSISRLIPHDHDLRCGARP